MILYMTRKSDMMILLNCCFQMSGSFRLGLVQLAVTSQKQANLTRAAAKVKEAAEKGAKVVSLPECFNSPYGTKHFPEYAEPVPSGPSCQALSQMAKANQVYLIGGSIPERSGDKLFNTTTVWDPDGSLLTTFRKIHLFDIDVPGKITFKESDALSPGQDIVTFETPFAKIGIGICYDIRFADLALLMAREGCQLLLYPGAFNMTTGPAHWELLARARALDNQVYVAVVSPARDESAEYVAWGHTSVVDPWGEIRVKAEAAEEVLTADIDLEYMNQVRSQIPITLQRRNDLYQVKRLKK